MEDKKRGFSAGKLFDFAKSVGESVKNTAKSISDSVEEKNVARKEQWELDKLESDLKKYMPLWKKELDSPDFMLPPIIRIVDDDVRRTVPACDGAVGFWTVKGMRMLNIYREYAECLGVSFHPYISDFVYYVDPCYKDLYIKIDDYFSYLKKVRVDELVSIAQDLGAKHVEVVFKTDDRQSHMVGAAGAGGLRIFSAAASAVNKSYMGKTLEIAAKMDFSGSETPVEPTPVYFKNESDIRSLIKMRMSPADGNRILAKTYSLKYSDSSGMSVTVAAAVDVAISSFGYKTTFHAEDEVRSESDIILEYSIEF